MNPPEVIVRIAAKGDGVSASGRHVPGAVPGDLLHADGSLEFGPHHIAPCCRHFGRCGGCQLQHCDEDTLAGFVTSRVINAASRQGLEPEVLLPAHLSPPRSRRRARLHVARVGRGIALGFRAAGSHQVIDMRQCPMLAGELEAVLAPVRALLADLRVKPGAEVELTLTDQGVDLGLVGLCVQGLATTEAMLDFAREMQLARLTFDQGFGAEPLWEPEPVTISFGSVSVPFPPGVFLQATADGEAALVSAACAWLAGARAVADLFSGLGTFAFALAGQGTKVLAVEAALDAHLACRTAAGRARLPVDASHRDLFRNPLPGEELDRFDAVLLDPPRAGAREQVGRLAQSRVERIVYISCNPSSWARDAAMLAAAGYRLAELRPVGQFRWSTHVELASLFLRS